VHKVGFIYKIIQGCTVKKNIKNIKKINLLLIRVICVASVNGMEPIHTYILGRNFVIISVSNYVADVRIRVL